MSRRLFQTINEKVAIGIAVPPLDTWIDNKSKIEAANR